MTTQAETQKTEGNKHFAQGEYKKAITCYTEALNLVQSHIYYSNRSACYYALREYQQALTDADACVQMEPTWAKGYYRKAVALMALNQFEEIETAIASEKLDEIKTLLSTNSFDEALKCLKLGAKYDPRDTNIKEKIEHIKQIQLRQLQLTATPAVLAKLRGNDFYQRGLFPEAIEAYTQALSLATEPQVSIDCLNNRSCCQYQLRAFKQAVADCSDVLELDPQNVKALLRRGLSYENLEKFELALVDMKKLQELDPGLQQVTNALTRLQKMIKLKEGFDW